MNIELCKQSCNINGPEWSFRRLTQAHKLAHMTVFDRLGLRDVGQPVLLFVLNDAHISGISCTQKELCHILHLSASTVTTSIKSLERRGYVRRRSDEKDMRRNIVEITDSGVEIAEMCRTAFADIDKVMYSGFSEEERKRISDVFDRITNNLLALTDKGAAKCREDC